MSKKLMRKKLALMLANLKKKRPYYCEVEYLESKNQQTDSGSTNAATYIDTGIIPNNNTRIECRMQFTTLVSGQSKEALNGTTGPESAPRFAWGFASISPYTNFYFGLGAQNLTTSVTRDTNVHTFVLDAKNKTCSIDNTTQSFTSSSSLNGTISIYLFARHITAEYANKPCNAKIYRYRNWDNDQLVQDLIPVLDWDFVPCMYDRITGQFFYNKGTGNFTCGREIHYVDYIESTGTQYIDTGFNPTSKTRWEYDYQFNNTSSSYIGNGMFITSPSTQRFAIGLIGDYFNMSYGADNVVSVPSDTDRHMFIIDANNMYWKIDNSTGTYSTEVTASLSRNIYFFARNGGSLYNANSGKLYGSKIYDNGILVRDYKPAIDENGVGFMFDRAIHTIYDNAGTGAFKYPARELTYVQSTAEQMVSTGISGNNDNLSFDFKYRLLAFVQYAGIFGNYNSGGEGYNCWRLLQANADNGVNYVSVNTRASSSAAVTLPKNNDYEIHIDKTNYIVNGTVYSSPTVKGTTNNNTIVIFAQRSDVGSAYRSTM